MRPIRSVVVATLAIIDTHSHHTAGLLQSRDARAAVSQGITTIVGGQDGGQSFPLAAAMDSLTATPAALNVAYYAGRNTIRAAVLGADFKRTATPAEVDSMALLLSRELASAALGLSSGLEYDPGIYSNRAEVLALAKVTADVYPYTYWQSTLTVLFPKRDFTNRAAAENILREIAKPEGLLIGDFKANQTYRGRTIAELAMLRHEAPAVTLMALIAQAQAWEHENHRDPESSESVVATSMSDADIEKLYAWPHTNVSSDGALDGAHPRGYGAFTRVPATYVRTNHAVSLEDAIRQMTSLAAAHVGIVRRGTITQGAYADLVLFDPATVTDHATPAAPHMVSTGVEGVWVNGRAVWRAGKTTGVYPGRVLRRAVSAQR